MTALEIRVKPTVMGDAVVFHVDLDAFYASVEQRDNPTLKDRPVIVGALPGQRGVVSTCSYEARRFGIHSAMPISEAYRRCPKAAFLPVRMGHYIEISKRIMTVLEEYTPRMRQISVDEAYLDLTGTERLFGPPDVVGRKMKQRVWEAERLTMSVGIAANRLMAKLASEVDKPDGLHRVLPGEEESFLDGLELKDLWGLGSKTLARLQRIGIGTIPQLRSYTEQELASLIGEGTARFLYRCARGLDPGIHSEKPRSHTMSHEITFEKDTASREHLNRVLLELSQQLIGRLLDSPEKGHTLTLKVRYHDFATTTIQKSLGRIPTSTEEIHSAARELLHERWDGRTPIRLIGVGLSGLAGQSAPEQGELFRQDDEKRRRVEEAVHRLRKSKDVAITRASLLGRRERRGQRDTEGPEKVVGDS